VVKEALFGEMKTVVLLLTLPLLMSA
jgi:hypothetical protein